ncbi:hypothetical protein KEJ15_03535 [Candidatus Bathyarchaeota archaeon]|nr:hypothetical protein [Candidatus Bathyarchaeota archaeon]
MTSNSSSKTSEELLREIRKLEIRLDDFLKEVFVRELRKYVEKLKDVSNRIEKLAGKPNRLAMLRVEVAQAFYETLKSESKAQHEKSHLLESYGALILALEREFQKLCS